MEAAAIGPWGARPAPAPPEPYAERIDAIFRAMGLSADRRRAMWTDGHEHWGGLTIDQAALTHGWETVFAWVEALRDAALAICAAAGKPGLVRRYQRRANRVERQRNRRNAR